MIIISLFFLNHQGILITAVKSPYWCDQATPPPLSPFVSLLCTFDDDPQKYQ